MGGQGLTIGIDVGTQGTKGLVLNLASGEVLVRASASYGLIEGLAPGAAEQHPDTWLKATQVVVARLLESVDPGRIVGIGVSGQQHGFVPLDARGEVIRPAKLWCDTATTVEARELSERFGHHLPVGYTASKILWLARHEPEHFARLAHVLLPHDWINFQLTGRMTMEAGDASGTGLFDPRERRFASQALEALGELCESRSSIADLLPPLIGPSDLAGEVDRRGARTFGLEPGVPVSAGGGDNMMSAIGSGATRPGIVVASLGTSGTVFTHATEPIVDPEGLIAPFCDSTGGWLPLLCVMNATGVTEEVRTAFGYDGAEGLARITREAERVPIGCDGVTFLPYLAGERVPDLPHARGSLLGLRPGSLRPGVLFRAALEGTSLNLAWGVERMRALGVPVDTVRLVGGGANSPLWRQILADVLDAPVTALAEPESAALGAAIQAGCSNDRSGTAPNGVDALASALVRVADATTEPAPASVARYRELGVAFRARVLEVNAPPGSPSA
ncbi:xylulokinase [Engelhardtia mirabilis]|uniref:Xylulose kinase n=1 Tax=Engelhardtia mirabilis TaxID=2528011 RepID=A0A518BNE5_9BACT|nr:Xylulose kinase [Planctomycetes bacterium Pla133]QDV02837.1 Xylulose kinase [Planctomycetes bacterium Pla86]